MSRTTDTERGARIAYEFAFDHAIQHELFASDLDPAFWRRVLLAAEVQLDESRAYREALRG